MNISRVRLFGYEGNKAQLDSQRNSSLRQGRYVIPGHLLTMSILDLTEKDSLLSVLRTKVGPKNNSLPLIRMIHYWYNPEFEKLIFDKTIPDTINHGRHYVTTIFSKTYRNINLPWIQECFILMTLLTDQMPTFDNLDANFNGRYGIPAIGARDYRVNPKFPMSMTISTNLE